MEQKRDGMRIEMTEAILNELYTYAVVVRRQLHRYPELGFKLDRTVKLVSEELDKMGIVYTDRYGTGSVVAEVGEGSFLLALRADMDALPVEEKTGLSYSSQIPGQMHACGHDAHTAVLLAVAKYLKSREKELPCRVRLIFQPSEEGQVSGAKMMVEQGIVDGVNHIICTHCDNNLEAGTIGICEGDYMAACVPATIRFKGKTSHATMPEGGVDAIAMAAEAYGKMRAMVKEEAHGARHIWSVGRFQGGHVHNVIADLCELDISFRFYDMDFADRVEKKAKKICKEIAEVYGGDVEFDWQVSTGSVQNDAQIVKNFREISRKLEIPVQEVKPQMTSEDFGWYLTKVPGMLFRFGTRNEEAGCTAMLHQNDFKIDESGMKAAIQAFVAYVQNGMEI